MLNKDQIWNCDDTINAADDLAIEESFPEIILIYTCLFNYCPHVHKSSSKLKVEMWREQVWCTYKESPSA